ncbi:MAG: hypothetical protein L0Y58_22350 [Verrucomicrobia subdivision 3 bacterium]|nr:hypothetical protein [Limisphaerales bacterium]
MPATPGAEPQPTEANSGVTVAASPEDEFPDDAAFQQLPGEQRASNWQRARSRIAELNQQAKDLSERAAIAAQIEQLGGLEALKADARYAQMLFAHQQDEAGNPLLDPQSGLPYITARPFIESLQQESPDAFYTMLWEAAEQPIDENQSVGDWLLQQKYGLNPALLDTYKQIQSPQDAVKYLPNSVSPDELTYVPAEFHEAYKSFDERDRQQLQDLSVDDEQRFLARLSERKQNIENQRFIAEARQQQEQAKLQQQQQWEQRIQQSALQIVNSKREQTLNAQLERLKQQYQPFGPDDAEGNQLVYDDVMAAGDRIFENPAIRQKAESAGNLYYQAERYKATNNSALASRALAQADALAMELQREFAKAVTNRVNAWNAKLKGRIVAAQPQQQTQTPNPQLQPQSVTNQPKPAPALANGTFGLSEERKQQIAAQLALQRQGAA